MTASDDVHYYFDVELPSDPNDEKQWIYFLDSIRNYTPSDNCKNKTIALYFWDIDTYIFCLLIDGNQIGKAIATQLSKLNYKQLPTTGELNPTPGNPKWVLFELDFMVGKKECYELFMGDLNNTDEQNQYLFGSIQETKDAYEAGRDANPDYHAYVLRHYFLPGAATSTTDYIPLNMP